MSFRSMPNFGYGSVGFVQFGICCYDEGRRYLWIHARYGALVSRSHLVTVEGEFFFAKTFFSNRVRSLYWYTLCEKRKKEKYRRFRRKGG